MNKYNEKMLHLLSDESTYKRLNNNPVASIQNKSNNFIKDLFSNDHIDVATYKSLVTHNGTLPKIYGLVKIHSQNCPLRLIVATIGVPTTSFLVS